MLENNNDLMEGSTLVVSKPHGVEGIVIAATANAINLGRTEGRKPSDKDSQWCSYHLKLRHTREPY